MGTVGTWSLGIAHCTVWAHLHLLAMFGQPQHTGFAIYLDSNVLNSSGSKIQVLSAKLTKSVSQNTMYDGNAANWRKVLASLCLA